MNALESLQVILSAAGSYGGEGVNHSAEHFTGQLELRVLEGGHAALLHYVATRVDGKHLHAETALIGLDGEGRLGLIPAMEELPSLLPHRLLEVDTEEDGTLRLTFSSGRRDDRNVFREEIGMEIDRIGRLLVYRHSWGLPGSEFGERSWCRFGSLLD
jgi:hypothetical protein